MVSSVLVTTPERLRALRSAWEDLLDRSATSEPTLHPAWLLPWWNVFGSEGGRELRVVTFHEAGRLIGLAPLTMRPYRYRRTIPFRRLESMASGEAAEDETCSDYLGIVADGDREPAVCEAFASALAKGDLGACDELVIPAMNGEAALPRLLQRALGVRGFRVSLDETAVCAYIALPKTWDEYLAALKQNKRGQLRKSLRAFEEWAGGPPEIVRAENSRQLEEQRRILIALHEQRWAGADPSGAGGVFNSRTFTAFHEEAMRELLAVGALDLGSMQVRGEAIAAFYNLRWRGKIYFYQAGRKLDVPQSVRVGVTMHAYLIRAAIESGLREYDFLAGDSQYKMSLATATRPLVTLRAVKPSVRETARIAAERAIDRARPARARLKELRSYVEGRIKR
jgi:CelD/BcsL family acetyltransferase involved in cellulose biosynthesis